MAQITITQARSYLEALESKAPDLMASNPDFITFSQERGLSAGPKLFTFIAARDLENELDITRDQLMECGVIRHQHKEPIYFGFTPASSLGIDVTRLKQLAMGDVAFTPANWKNYTPA